MYAVTWKLKLFLAVSSLWAFTPAEGVSLPFAGLDDLRGPYEGTGMFGEALHVQPLGRAGKWPICAVWSSGRKTMSPYLGFGWSIPALESRFVPLDVRRWAFYQPDGFVRIFVQAERGDGNVLTGGPAWTAIVKGEVIRVTADPHDDGPMSEFIFRQGRLVRMNCEEGSFEVKYRGRLANSIVSHGRTLLEVTSESSPEKRVVFRFSGGRSQQVEAICRPATVFGAPGASSATMPSEESCLARLQTPAGTVDFSYGGQNGKAFFQAGDMHWTWDVYSRKILSCGDWKYVISQTNYNEDELKETPSFDRRHSDGRQESYSNNRYTGLLVQKFTNGTSRTSKVFTSGPLAYRRTRWTKNTNRDGSSVRTDYTYNEAGRVVYRRITREGKDAGTDEIWLNESGAVFHRRVNGQEVPLK